MSDWLEILGGVILAGLIVVMMQLLENSTKEPQTVTLYHYDISLEDPIQSETLEFTDSLISIKFEIRKKEIGFNIKNKSNRAIKINWDEIVYISPSGAAHRVIHSGIRYIDRNKPQAPSVIPPNANFSDIIVPSDNIYYLEVPRTGIVDLDLKFSKLEGWRVADLIYPGQDLKGKTFKVYMPLEIDGEKKNYTFTFKIKDVTIEEIKL